MRFINIFLDVFRSNALKSATGIRSWRSLCITNSLAPPAQRFNYNRRLKRKRNPTQRQLHGRRKRITAILEKLRSLEDTPSTISYEGFLQLCSEVSGERNGAKLANACMATGHILHHDGSVYTRTNTVVSALHQQSPMNISLLEDRLKVTRSEFDILHEQKSNLDRVAYIETRRFFYVGLLAVVFQWFLLSRLTFFEYSWDVIEPVSFLIRLVFQAAGYAFFMRYYVNPRYKQATEAMQTRKQELLYRSAKFPLERYNQLWQRIQAYETLLQENVKART